MRAIINRLMRLEAANSAMPPDTGARERIMDKLNRLAERMTPGERNANPETFAEIKARLKALVMRS